MKTCSDCLYCKIRISKKTLMCSLNNWYTYGMGTKVFIVNKGEVGKRDMNLRHRTIFDMAQSCGDYEEM